MHCATSLRGRTKEGLCAKETAAANARARVRRILFKTVSLLYYAPGIQETPGILVVVGLSFKEGVVANYHGRVDDMAVACVYGHM